MLVKCKTFEVYLRELIYHPERSKKWLADKRLSEMEKSILRGHLLLRDNKTTEALKEVEKFSASDIEFVNDHRNLLLGICHNNLGNYASAKKYLELASFGLEKSHQYYHLFTTLYNLSILAYNQGQLESLRSSVERMVRLRVDGVLPQIRLLCCQFLLALETGEDDKVRECIKKLNGLKSEMPESELGPQLVSEFMFYMKNEELDKAEAILQEMKKYRKFTLSENYNFMKGLLGYLRNDSTLYVYPNMFSHSSSVLYYQMKVIETLQVGDKESAGEFWKKLQVEHSQSLYQDDLQWTGKKCLFSLCLEKSKANLASTAPFKIVIGDGPKHQVLYNILLEANAPVKAAELYEILYGEVVQEKDDLKKLVRLVVTVRDYYKAEIVSKKGTYQLIKKNQVATG